MNHALSTVQRDDSRLVTTGDARRAILDTIQQLRNGDMDVNRGLAIAANMKVLNEGIFAEVAAAKMTIEAKKAGHSFGEMIVMGQRKINGD